MHLVLFLAWLGWCHCAVCSYLHWMCSCVYALALLIMTGGGGVLRVVLFFERVFVYLGLFERIKVDSALWCFWTFRSWLDGPSVLYAGFCIDPMIFFFVCIQLALICIFTNDVYTFLGWSPSFFLYSQLNRYKTGFHHHMPLTLPEPTSAVLRSKR